MLGDGFGHVLGRLEFHDPPGWNPNLQTGRRIVPGPGGALFHREYANARQGDARVFLETAPERVREDPEKAIRVFLVMAP